MSEAVNTLYQEEEKRKEKSKKKITGMNKILTNKKEEWVLVGRRRLKDQIYVQFFQDTVLDIINNHV